MQVSNELSNTQLIHQLQQQARAVLDALIPEAADVVLLDYPHHSNVGDSLIWLGEVAYLKSRKAKVRYVCQIENYNLHDMRNYCGKDTVILLHGGGNFGTLWQHLHAFRLQVMRDFPHHRIVQLPQTTYFEQDNSLRQTAEAIQQHGQFTLLVRSQTCLSFAQQHFVCNTHLCPDMAFFIGPLTSRQSPVVDRFVLARTDTEKSAHADTSKIEVDSSLSIEQDDWLQESKAERMMIRLEKYTRFVRRYVDRHNLLLLLIWNQLASYRLARGMAMLSRGKVVITDRLHAHILSVLINKPHVLMDNSYGKLSNFYNTWTHRINNVSVGATHAKYNVESTTVSPVTQASAI